MWNSPRSPTHQPVVTILLQKCTGLTMDWALHQQVHCQPGPAPHSTLVWTVLTTYFFLYYLLFINLVSCHVQIFNKQIAFVRAYLVEKTKAYPEGP